MKKQIRSHRVMYLIVLLMVAVVLTTALVVAGERGVEQQNKNSESSGKPAAQLVSEGSVG